MLSLTVRHKSIIPIRENGEVALGPLEFVLSNPFSVNTAKTYLSIIGHIENVCEFFEIEDYEDRLAYGSGLSRDELIDINLGLQYRAVDLKKLLRAKKSGVRTGLLFKDWDAGSQVSAGVIARNKIVTKQYFECLMENGEKCLRRHVCPPTFIEARREARQQISEIIVAPKVVRNQQGTKAALEDLLALEKFITSNEPSSIWKSAEVALRNSVMFDLQYWCGLRIGEVLSLTLADMKTRSEFISVVDRRDEENDPREAYAPAIKTYQRPVWVPKLVWKKLVRWREVKLDIQEELWDLGLQERQNDYLFVSLDRRQASFGSPLSTSSASKAFDQIKEAANVDAEGGSHLLRHLSAMRFVHMRVNAGQDRESITQDLREQFGWSPTSTMPLHYTSREVTRQNNEMMKKQDAEYTRRMQERQLEEGRNTG